MSSHPIVGEPSPASPGTQELRQNLLDLAPKEMLQYFTDLGEKPFRATQILRWIHQHGVTDFDQMSNISKALREQLKLAAEIKAPEVVTDQLSLDGTRKWLLRVKDKKGSTVPANNIEMVFIPEEGRGTLCVSSQVGCTLDCSFCCTARQGFNRNLNVSEVIGQVWLAKKLLAEANSANTITNIVMMGMGEPLHNFKNVVGALHLMVDDNCYGLSKRRVTLSTAGVVPMIDRLREETDVSLAVSLHASTNDLRDKLVPVNQRYPIETLIAACKRYVEGAHKRRITFEYIMLDGINDQELHARQLAKLLKGIPAKINLIPFNPFPNSGYQRSPDLAIDRFRAILQQQGYVTVTRKTRGDDINAACGQLAGSIQDLSRRHRRFESPRFGANHR